MPTLKDRSNTPPVNSGSDENTLSGFSSPKQRPVEFVPAEPHDVLYFVYRRLAWIVNALRGNI